MADKPNNKKASVVVMDPPYLMFRHREFDTAEFCLGHNEGDLDSLQEEIVTKSLRAALQCTKDHAFILMWGTMSMIVHAEVPINLTIALPQRQNQ